jgi:hypothetical protein
MNGDADKKIVSIGLRPERAQERIREIAKDTAKVIVGDHAKDRMEEREISDIEVYRSLQRGHVLRGADAHQAKGVEVQGSDEAEGKQRCWRGCYPARQRFSVCENR